MQPYERLRHLARWSGDDDTTLVSEAADCLAGFADDPAGLVVACRRLLAHHPTSGPLWWLCARVLTAPDPARGAWEAWERVEGDTTGARLAERLPFPHDDPVAVLGLAGALVSVVSTRPDLDLVAVRRRGGDQGLAARLRRHGGPLRIVDDVEAAALDPSHVLIETTAAAPSGVVVPRGTGETLDALGAPHTWLVAGIGCVLPDRLFTSLRRRLESAGDEAASVEVLEPARFEQVAGPGGLDPPLALARRVDCPVAPELLRLGT